MLWHAYSLPQITMETLSAEAGLDAMVLAYGRAYIWDGVFEIDFLITGKNMRGRFGG